MRTDESVVTELGQAASIQPDDVDCARAGLAGDATSAVVSPGRVTTRAKEG